MPEIPPHTPDGSFGQQETPGGVQARGTSGAGIDIDAITLRADSNLRRMLYFRRQYDQRRSFFYRQYVSQQDRKTFPDNITPRSNTYVPYPLSNVETIVSRTSDAFFSFDPAFECKGRSQADEPAAERMQLVLGYKLHKARWINALEELMRNLAIYGFAGLKVDWDWGYDIGVDAQPEFLMQPVTDAMGNRVINPQTGQPATQPQIDPNTGAPIVIAVHPVEKKIPRQRPKLIPIDVYDLLVDPDNGMVAHMSEKNWAEMKREWEMNPDLYFAEGMQQLDQKISQDSDPDSVIVRVAELWDEMNDTVTLMTYGKDSEAISWKDLRASFRQASYSAWKRKLYGGDPVLLYHGPNPFAHKRAPILYTSFIKVPGEKFGLGAIEIISDLTESFNRFVNMITDNWNMGINRRYAYNVEADIDHTALNLFNTPGGKVGVVGNPNDVIAPLPFFTPQKGDYALLDVYRNMIELSSGVNDFYSKGVGSAQGNRTATGISQVMNESNFRFKLFIRNMELDILQPMLEMCASMIQQYMTNAEEVRIADAPVEIDKWPIVKPEELIGNFDFDLVCANYATNKVVRQRNMLAFANWASQTPYWNMGEGIRELGKVFEIRNINKLIKSDQQVAQEQQAAMNQQIAMMTLEAALMHGSKMDQLNTKAKWQAQRPAAGGKKKPEGRPRGIQQEGKLPGSDMLGPARQLGQMLGMGGMGLSGLGNTPGGNE